MLKKLSVYISPLIRGLILTWVHFKNAKYRRKPNSPQANNYFSQQNGSVTVQYPSEQIPIPDVGRYRLYLEVDDCIGCDQCSRICPVNCITIEKIKSPDVIGTTSDGTKIRFYLPTFDIDLAQCCFCGLCTVVCPTECLTMTKNYDYSSTNRQDFILKFGNLSPEEAIVKQAELDDFENAKKAAKNNALNNNP